MRYDWQPKAEEFLRVAEMIDSASCIGLGELNPIEFRRMIATFCGDSGNFEFNQMQCGEPNRTAARIIALCFAAAMCDTGDI